MLLALLASSLALGGVGATRLQTHALYVFAALLTLQTFGATLQAGSMANEEGGTPAGHALDRRLSLIWGPRLVEIAVAGLVSWVLASWGSRIYVPTECSLNPAPFFPTAQAAAASFVPWACVVASFTVACCYLGAACAGSPSRTLACALVLLVGLSTVAARRVTLDSPSPWKLCLAGLVLGALFRGLARSRLPRLDETPKQGFSGLRLIQLAFLGANLALLGIVLVAHHSPVSADVGLYQIKDFDLFLLCLLGAVLGIMHRHALALPSPVFLGASAVLVFLGIPYFDYVVPGVPGYIRFGALTACNQNLKTLATSLEMYSADNAGRYPTTLARLTPNYCWTIPPCPAARKDTYSHSFTSVCEPDAYTVFCEGCYHHANELHIANYPQYSSYSGLIVP